MAGGSVAPVMSTTTAPTGLTVLDDASKTALQNSGFGGYVALTTSRNIASTDDGLTLSYGGSTDITLTIPQSISITSFTVVQMGAGRILFAQGSGVGFDNFGATQGVNTFVTCIKAGADQYAFQNPVPAGPYTIIQGGIPFILPSSGSMANNGALTVTTALPTTYPNAYVYLPANAVAAGSAAGWYYAVFSSTTAATVYNNRYTTGFPTIPASPTAFSTTGPGAYTQTSGSDIQGPNTTIPGGSMGPNGSLETMMLGHVQNSVNIKTMRVRLSTLNISSDDLTSTNIMTEGWRRVENCGIQNRQVGRASSGFGNQTTAPSFNTINTSADQTVEFTLKLNDPTDYAIWLRYAARVTRGN